jgi:hypothetical protein
MSLRALKGRGNLIEKNCHCEACNAVAIPQFKRSPRHFAPHDDTGIITFV